MVIFEKEGLPLFCSEDGHSPLLFLTIVLGFMTSADQINSFDIYTFRERVYFRAKLNVLFDPRNGRV